MFARRDVSTSTPGAAAEEDECRHEAAASPTGKRCFCRLSTTDRAKSGDIIAENMPFKAHDDDDFFLVSVSKAFLVASSSLYSSYPRRDDVLLLPCGSNFPSGSVDTFGFSATNFGVVVIITMRTACGREDLG
jgi:hypothetical protein